jgi:hypothetical protein
MARRVWVGTGQLLLAVAGFCLIIGWMFEYFHRFFLQQLGEPGPPDSSGLMGKWGLIFFGASWLWSLVTSVSLLRQVRSDELAGRRPVPPRIADLPGKPPEQS